MTDRSAQIQEAASKIENFLDRMIIAHPRSMCIVCGVAGIICGKII